MKYFSYLNTAATIIGLYQAQQPFHLFIKDFFRQHKKYGSADRKQITHLCYCWFRTGSSLQDLPATEKIITALFVCSRQSNAMLAQLRPEWDRETGLAVEDKYAFIQRSFAGEQVFPFPDQLSEGINRHDFILSHFIQPSIFLRARPGYLQPIIQRLQAAGLAFSLPAANCIALPNTTKTDGLVIANKEAVVQDYSSQQTGALIEMTKQAAGRPAKVWDCCAASGGKSILAKDVLGSIDLTVSDIRESVLINLKKRLAAAGIGSFHSLLADLTLPVRSLAPGAFQLILADVPCSGSGTWGRTPERLTFFAAQEIDRYQQLQQKIVRHVLPHLQKDGFFLYITCSVFKKENEAMVDFIREQFGLELVKMEVLTGYTKQADTMFAALLRKVAGDKS